MTEYLHGVMTLAAMFSVCLANTYVVGMPKISITRRLFGSDAMRLFGLNLEGCHRR